MARSRKKRVPPTWVEMNSFPSCVPAKKVNKAVIIAVKERVILVESEVKSTPNAVLLKVDNSRVREVRNQTTKEEESRAEPSADSMRVAFTTEKKVLLATILPVDFAVSLILSTVASFREVSEDLSSASWRLEPMRKPNVYFLVECRAFSRGVFFRKERVF